MLEITLPTLHAGQVAAYLMPGKRKAVRCGRRWGKTELEVTIAADAAAKGQRVGLFAPENKFLDEPYESILDILDPITSSSSRQKGRIRTMTGGHVDFWTLDNDRAGRGRKYHKALIDEAAFTKPNMRTIWERAIAPTLIDYAGSAIAFSNTNGVDPENFFWWICNDPESEWVQYHAPMSQNPFLPPGEIDKAKARYHPLVFRQEVLAEFVDFSGEAFFTLDWMLINNQPVEPPTKCDAVFAVIDTAIKDQKEHDGTAVSFYASSQHTGTPLVLLDWEILSIEGSLLEQWLPSVFQRLEELARAVNARKGSLGVWIEDKGSGSILLQQAARRGWQAMPLPNDLAAAGKSGRAVNVSGHIYQGKLKLSRHAFDKVVTFKGVSRNHWIAQVTGFRVGAKEGAADDLLDTMTYGVAIALGNSEGY